MFISYPCVEGLKQIENRLQYSANLFSGSDSSHDVLVGLTWSIREVFQGMNHNGVIVTCNESLRFLQLPKLPIGLYNALVIFQRPVKAFLVHWLRVTCSVKLLDL